MANTEWWQRGPVDGVPAVLQPVAHILFQVRESVGEIVEALTEHEWNARPAGVASTPSTCDILPESSIDSSPTPRQRPIDRTTRRDSV
jgi:hypothetical protein